MIMGVVANSNALDMTLVSDVIGRIFFHTSINSFSVQSPLLSITASLNLGNNVHNLAYTSSAKPCGLLMVANDENLL